MGESLLATSSGIDGRKLTHGKCTGADKDEAGNDTINDSDRAALSDGEREGGAHPEPAVADVPSYGDDVQSGNVPFGFLGEAQT